MAVAWPLAITEKDNSAALPVTIFNELQKVIDCGRIDNLEAALFDQLIAEPFTPAVSIFADYLFERVTAVSFGPCGSSRKSNINENRRAPASRTLD